MNYHFQCHQLPIQIQLCQNLSKYCYSHHHLKLSKYCYSHYHLKLSNHHHAPEVEQVLLQSPPPEVEQVLLQPLPPEVEQVLLQSPPPEVEQVLLQSPPFEVEQVLLHAVPEVSEQSTVVKTEERQTEVDLDYFSISKLDIVTKNIKNVDSDGGKIELKKCDDKHHSNTASITKTTLSASIIQRKRRCKTCSGCLANSCGKCRFCLDSPKFGGPGKLKQVCIKRHCVNITNSTKNLHGVKNDGISNSVYIAQSIKSQITLSDISHIQNGSWLGSFLIDYLLEYITSDCVDETKRLKNTDFFSLQSFVFELSLYGKFTDITTYIKDDLSNKLAILLPICVYNHWILAVIWPTRRKVVTVFDSIGGYMNKLEPTLISLIEFLGKCHGITSGTYIFTEESVPKQENHMCSDLGL